MSVKIEYIGWRPGHVDLYTKQRWEKTGAIHDVPGHLAGIMLRKHKDVYKLAPGVTEQDLSNSMEEGRKERADEESIEIEMDALRMQVTIMEKDELANFAQSRYGIKLKKSLSTENMRSSVVNMIDLYGVP